MANWRDPSQEQKKVRARPELDESISASESDDRREKNPFLKLALVACITAAITVFGIGQLRTNDSPSVKDTNIEMQQIRDDLKQLSADINQIKGDVKNLEAQIEQLK